MFFEETREGTLVIEAHKVGNLLKACRKARDRLFLLFHFVWTEFMVQHDDVQKSKKAAIISGCHQATYKGKVRPEQLDKCQREL